MPSTLAPPTRSSQSANASPADRSSAKRPDQADRGLGRRLGRQAQGPVAELDLGVADVAAEQQLVAGGGPAVGPALGAVEADVGDVVLAAAVGAAGDVDADPADVRQPGLLEGPADVVGQAPALGHGQVAGVGARAGDHVAGQLGARLGHADLVEAVVQLGQLLGRQAPEGQVLAVGHPHVDAEVPHDGGQGPELVAR